VKLSKKIISLLPIFLFLIGCGGNQGPQVAVEAPVYNFLEASATIQKQPTMRLQRNLAFNNAKYTLKTQVHKEVTQFLTDYLRSIGLSNEEMIERLSGYINMDMDPLFEKVEQAGIEIVEEKAMKITVRLAEDAFEQSLNEALKINFQRDRSVWDRFQEQSSQDLLNASLTTLLSSITK
jgi:hypothetical protein